MLFIKIFSLLGNKIVVFNGPSGIAVYGDTNMVIVDSWNHNIQIFEKIENGNKQF
jgi:hypothetical protein